MNFDYKSKKESYREESVFEELKINIKVDVTNDADQRFYFIKNIESASIKFEAPVLQTIGPAICEKINTLNFSEPHSKIRKSWSAFYALKEIIDIIRTEVSINKKGYQLYFRGQGGDWPLKPTLYRDGKNGYTDEFRIHYDSIYESIANKFPHEIEYSSEFGSEERALNLAVLQHYGLGTPLVDITENPFIAMMFMTNDYKHIGEHSALQLDVFFIREDGDNKLFQSTRNNEHNPRIAVQKGAFLNFEKLDDALLFGDKKIGRISINIVYDGDSDSDTNKLLPDGLSEESVNNSQIALETAAKDIQKKLESFNYMNSDLFPDFYKYLEMLKIQYTQGKDDNPWYELASYKST